MRDKAPPCFVYLENWIDFLQFAEKLKGKKNVILAMIEVIKLRAALRISSNTVAFYVLSLLKVPIIQNQYKSSRLSPPPAPSAV